MTHTQTTLNPSTTYSRTLAMIGVGRWGRNLARNFYELGALHTICDTNESFLDQFEHMASEVNLTTHLNAVLDNPLITRVAIAVPAIHHYTVTKQALLAGKDVYVEKPFCLDLKEGEELCALAEEKGCILMVGHLLQYHPCIIKIKEMMKEGKIGKLQYIVSNRLNLGHFRTDENAMWNFAPHDISIILSLCENRLPERVRCIGADYLTKGVADSSMTVMSFPDDVRAHVYVSWLNPFKESKLVVIGSKGMIVFDDTKGWNEKLVHYPDYVRWVDGAIPETNQKEGVPVAVQEGEPLRFECIHYLNACDQRVRPQTDSQEAMRVMKVLIAAQASMDEDGNTKVPAEQFESSQDYFAHPTATVDAGAQIGAGTKIWHYTHVMGQTSIGERCKIGQNVFIASTVQIGSNVKIQNNVSLYSGTLCDDDVFIGPSAVFTNVINPRSTVVRHDEYLPTHLCRGVTVGANATVLCGTVLGAHSFIGAGAVVTKDVKPYALMVGNPARQSGWMSRHGHRLDLPVEIPFGEERSARCPSTDELYTLKEGCLTLSSEQRELLEV